MSGVGARGGVGPLRLPRFGKGGVALEIVS